jgi:hypothetical protein
MVTSHSESFTCTLVIYLSLRQGVCRGVYVGSRDIIVNPAREILNTFILVFLQELKVTVKKFFSRL